MTALRKNTFAFVGASFANLLFASIMLLALVDSAFAKDKLTHNSTQVIIKNIDDDAVDEAYMQKELHALIYGADCSGGAQITPRSTSPKNTINASNQSIIDTTKYTDTKSRAIAFNGTILNGGIFDDKQKLYMSADRQISYALTSGTLDNGTLEIKAICEKQGFVITNFHNGDFGVRLSKNPTKEVAIVINVNHSTRSYTDALKDIAPFVAKHILGDPHKQYAKISLITFSYVRVLDLGTFYNAEDFANAINSAKGTDSATKMVNVALIEAMRNFTKDNGLKKEVYLITDGGPDDEHKAEKMLVLTKNLNQNIVKNTQENADNRVKIHTFALGVNSPFLKDLAKITGGSYNEVGNTYDFKKQILTLSNDGKPFDMRELSNEIRPSKNHKIYDPDDPHNKPEKKVQ